MTVRAGMAGLAGAALLLAAAATAPARAQGEGTAAGGAGVPLPADTVLTRIAFGSCALESVEQPIWGTVLAQQPQLFVFLGDNVYGDTEDMDVLREAYARLEAQPGYRNLRRIAHVIATWDDHDYGRNDAGAEYPMKAESRAIMLDVFGVPEDSPRRTQEGGLYGAYAWGPEGRRVQVILLDTRWGRTEPRRVSDAERGDRDARDMGPYLPNRDAQARMLDEAQWAWLEAQLRQPADLRLIGTSIPFLMDFTGWETWANFPRERERLIDLIAATGANGVIFLSGDTHWAEVSLRTDDVPYPLWELTSSGLTQEWPRVSPNDNRLGEPYWRANAGFVTIDWDAPDPEVTLEIRNVHTDLVLQNTIRLSGLRAAR